jgi:hypothetical protein
LLVLVIIIHFGLELVNNIKDFIDCVLVDIISTGSIMLVQVGFKLSIVVAPLRDFLVHISLLVLWSVLPLVVVLIVAIILVIVSLIFNSSLVVVGVVVIVHFIFDLF